ncbi:MAG: DUF222 domain-containing protein [Acidimicrobiaceae bacterium]|nr:DUF222 domain-containing protein [Acidimicrobiaceae bacterium]
MILEAARRAETAAAALLAAVNTGTASTAELRRVLTATRSVTAAVGAAQTAAAEQIARRERHGDGGAEILAASAGLSQQEARNQVTTAAALQKVPELRDAVQSGDVPQANARRLADAITRTSSAAVAGDAELLAQAQSTRPEQFARTAQRWIGAHQADDGTAEYLRQRAKRYLRMHDTEDGMVRLHGEFDKITGTRIRNRLRHTAGRLLDGDKKLPQSERRKFPQCMADALQHFADRASAGTDRSEKPASSSRRSTGCNSIDGGDAKNGGDIHNAAENTANSGGSMSAVTGSGGCGASACRDDTVATVHERVTADSTSPAASSSTDDTASANNEDTNSGDPNTGCGNNDIDSSCAQCSHSTNDTTSTNNEDTNSGDPNTGCGNNDIDSSCAQCSHSTNDTTSTNNEDTNSGDPNTGCGNNDIDSSCAQCSHSTDAAASASSEDTSGGDGINSDESAGSSGGWVADITVLAHVDDTTGELIGELSDGSKLPAAVLEELSCNARWSGLVFDRAGDAIWRSRSRRTVSDTQWQALLATYGGCFHCAAPAGMCQAHHITPYSQGGATSLDNLIMVCWNCHHKIHHHNWQITKHTDGSHSLHPPDDLNTATQPRHGPAHADDYPPEPESPQRRKQPPARPENTTRRTRTRARDPAPATLW